MIQTFACEESVEDFAQVGILRVFVKATRTDMIEISRKFPWNALTQIFCTDRLLLRQDKLLLLLLIRGYETLPWETAPEEVEKHVS